MKQASSGHYVEISDNGGITWTVLSDINCSNASTWYQPNLIDLSGYKTSPIQIRFRLQADGDGTVGDGWYIDDVEIKDICDDPPIIDSYTATPTLGDPPLTVSFNIVAHDPGQCLLGRASEPSVSFNIAAQALADGITAYEWDFDGDGVTDEITTEASTTFTYTQCGEYRATCTVRDNGPNSVVSEPILISVCLENPVPDIKVNNQDTTVFVNEGDPITVTESISAGDRGGTLVDRWVGALASDATYWLNESGVWVKSDQPVLRATGELADQPLTTLLDANMPQGPYMLFTIIDKKPNGILDNTAWLDSIIVVGLPTFSAVARLSDMSGIERTLKKRLREIIAPSGKP